MTSLFVNQLTNLDFSYFCPERGLVGDTYIVDAVLIGKLNEQGMVFDFGHIKKKIKASLDNLCDHRLVVPVANSDIKYIDGGDYLEVCMTTPKIGVITCKAPTQAVLLVNAERITSVSMIPILENALINELPDNVSSVHINLYHEPIVGAFYHYSHGLKKHFGDCQRIAHGHRSKISIKMDGDHSRELELYWSELWEDIYIGVQEDLIDRVQKNDCLYYTFGYTSSQGYFELTIPSNLCYLIETDSTVELLAEHVVQKLSKKYPGKCIQVTAYEGLNKGAIAVGGSV